MVVVNEALMSTKEMLAQICKELSETSFLARYWLNGDNLESGSKYRAAVSRFPSRVASVLYVCRLLILRGIVVRSHVVEKD